MVSLQLRIRGEVNCITLERSDSGLSFRLGESLAIVRPFKTSIIFGTTASQALRISCGLFFVVHGNNIILFGFVA